MTLISGDLTVNRLNKSTGIKFRAFCLFVTTGYPFSLEGGILNVESDPSASGDKAEKIIYEPQQDHTEL